MVHLAAVNVGIPFLFGSLYVDGILDQIYSLSGSCGFLTNLQ